MLVSEIEEQIRRRREAQKSPDGVAWFDAPELEAEFAKDRFVIPVDRFIAAMEYGRAWNAAVDARGKEEPAKKKRS